jgi:flavin-dependent dehydrogenase
VSVETCDVAIVGGGPAGAYAAYLLATRGARVRLFDPSHPREKPCGGGVTGRALELVAPLLGLQSIAGVPVDAARFEADTDRSAADRSARDRSVPDRSASDRSAHDRSASVSLDDRGFSADSSLIVMSRRVFDRALLDGAIAAGAVHDPSRVTHVELANSHGGVLVATQAQTFHAQYVLGADGANSFVRRRLS